MKYILTLGVLILATSAKAIPFVPGPEPAASVVETVRDTFTCAGLSISNTTATNVIVTTTPGYSHLNVQNLDGSASLWCSDSPSVTNAATALQGWKIASNTSVNWIIKRFTNWYCLTDGGSTTRAAVCRGN